MQKCFVCSKAKCTHRWEPTGHQMTCCGVMWCGVVWCSVVWCGGAVCSGAERGKRGEQGHWAPDACLSLLCPVVLVGHCDALACSNIKYQMCVTRTRLSLSRSSAVLAYKALYHHRLTKENWKISL